MKTILYFVIFPGKWNCLQQFNLNADMQILVYISVLLTVSNGCYAIWCYQCTTATPGCGQPFNWRGVGYLGNPCPDNEDVCVKLIERKGAKEVITRDCLSNFKAFRMDIPADTYEGCRTAAKDVNLANFVNNTVKELDIRRDWYDETVWCFCFLDHRCNSGSVNSNSIVLLVLTSIIFLTKVLF